MLNTTLYVLGRQTFSNRSRSRKSSDFVDFKVFLFIAVRVMSILL